MKFGKYLEEKKLDLPEYSSHFIDYKALKKLIKHLAIPLSSSDYGNQLVLDETDESVIYHRLQENKASFFFKLERELERINLYYLEKESELRISFDLLNSCYSDYMECRKPISKGSISYRKIKEGIKKLERDLSHFEQFVELNRTGFSKVLKKWDKRSHSHTKDFYLATVVSIQPIFAKNEVYKWNSTILTLSSELKEIENKERSSHNESRANVVSIDPNTTNYSTLTKPTCQTLHMNSISNELISTSFDTELEIDIWHMEIMNISQLKDTKVKNNLIETFIKEKVKKITDKYDSHNTDNENIINKILTRSFALLIATPIDDLSLQQFLIHGRKYINLASIDDDDTTFSRRNIFHEAATCKTQSRVFILFEALEQMNQLIISSSTLKKLFNAQDIYACTPLHYASKLGKLDFVKTLISSNLLESVDFLDNDSKTPLIISITNNFIEITKTLLVDGKANPFPQTHEFSKPQFVPLNIGCAYNNFDAVKLILEMGSNSIDLKKVCDIQGLSPLHIVAKNGGSCELIDLLISNGANPNSVDGFNKWTPIFYAVQEGHSRTVDELIKKGAFLNVVDEDNLSPLFYAAWEGHLDVLNVLLEHMNPNNKHLRLSTDLNPRYANQINLYDLSHEISDFSLPPPIIPLRKYGHNFLERKIFVKLIFKAGIESIILHREDARLISSPGRITLTSTIPDIIPKNILFPISDEEESIVIFQVESLDDFSIDFEIFPIFGTRIMAKTTAMSSYFTNYMDRSTNAGQVNLPLFDPYLKSIGELQLDFQIIFPYHGIPLEITKYDTYWKSTSAGQCVTSSSLCGKYVTIKLVILADGTIISAPENLISIGSINLIINEITLTQLENICNDSLDNIPQINDEEQLEKLLKTKYMRFENLLSKIAAHIKLNLEVCFPTDVEIKYVPVKLSRHIDINKLLDAILDITFENVRKLHESCNSRFIIFTSCNTRICAILNWKQPNYPVLFQMNGIKEQDRKFIKDTSHHLGGIALSHFKELYDDPCSCSIREAVRFASHNNLLGIVIPSALLNLTSDLVEQFRRHGLLLITSNIYSEHDSITCSNIKGSKNTAYLQFKDRIDV